MPHPDLPAIEQLIFVRHGQSRHHVLGLVGGWTDTSLTDLGREQAAATAARLAERNWDDRWCFVCSDLKRTVETAEPIGAALGVTFEREAAFRELYAGDATDLTVAEAEQIALPVPDELSADWRPYPNAETWREMATRVAAGIDRLVAEGHTRLCVVGHGNMGQALVGYWLGLPVASGIGFLFDAASVTELGINEWGEREIRRLNS